MSPRHTELWLNSIPRQGGLILSLNTVLFDAPAAAGHVYAPNAFGSDPSRQSHERYHCPEG